MADPLKLVTDGRKDRELDKPRCAVVKTLCKGISQGLYAFLIEAGSLQGVLAVAHVWKPTTPMKGNAGSLSSDGWQDGRTLLLQLLAQFMCDVAKGATLLVFRNFVEAT